MRIQEHNNKLETNVENETQNFGIGDASVVIEILRNRLYEHKIRTLVQEYISNARDSHRELGKFNNAFEITVPTRLNPVFKVRDFGPGISPDRMRDVFVMYGASTKRGTNNQTGGFGIGAKSAWSYTDSFTIVSIVDGLRRTYVAHTGINHNGRLDLVSTDTTEDSNGTEIQVAVKNHDIEEFRSAIFRAIYFWQEKPILKGELDPPTLVKGRVISELLEVTDKQLLPEYIRNGYYDLIAVIDGIPYGIGDKLLDKVPSLAKLCGMSHKLCILHFGNGVVEVAASRESIADSTHTIASLEKLGKKALLEAQTYISDAFGKVKSTSEYISTYSKLTDYFKVEGYEKYGEYHIIGHRVRNPLFSKVKLTLVHCMGRYGRQRSDKITKKEISGIQGIHTDHINDLFFVTKQESKLIQNKRIREYFKNHNYMVLVEQLNTTITTLDANGTPILDATGKAILTPVAYPNEFKQIINELGAKDFLSVVHIDSPKIVKAKVKHENSSFCLKVVDKKYHEHTTLANNTQKWIYVCLHKGSWPKTIYKPDLADLSIHLNESVGMKVCGIGERTAKMIKDDKNFISLKDYLDTFKPSKNDVLAAKNALANNNGAIKCLTDLKGIEDPFLNEMIEQYKAFSKPEHICLPTILKDKLSELQEIKDFKMADKHFGKLMLDDYSLVYDLNYSKNKKEIAFYINAKYKVNKKGK